MQWGREIGSPAPRRIGPNYPAGEDLGARQDAAQPIPIGASHRICLEGEHIFDIIGYATIAETRW